MVTHFLGQYLTSKQKTDMTKVAIKNENITSFGGIYIISLWLFILPHWFGWGGMIMQEPRTPKNPHING